MRLIQGRYYVPNNSAIVVTGDVNPDDVFKSAEQIFRKLAENVRLIRFKEFPLVEHPPLPKSEGTIVEQPVQNVIINIGWQGPSIGKDDRSTYAADVFSYILSQPDSRFQRNLVDKGLAAKRRHRLLHAAQCGTDSDNFSDYAGKGESRARSRLCGSRAV